MVEFLVTAGLYVCVLRDSVCGLACCYIQRDVRSTSVLIVAEEWQEHLKYCFLFKSNFELVWSVRYWYERNTMKYLNRQISYYLLFLCECSTCMQHTLGTVSLRRRQRCLSFSWCNAHWLRSAALTSVLRTDTCLSTYDNLPFTCVMPSPLRRR